jgi:uncharacterized protein DUF1206
MDHMAARSTPAGRPWIDRLARFGFAARALVYVLVGFLAAGAAAGLGGRTTDTHGAIRTVGAQRFGTVLLVVLSVGLASYAAWRFVQAALDLERKGDDLKGLAVRTSYAASGVVHAGLAFTAGSLAVGLGPDRSDPVRTWAGRLMDAPYGRWVVGALGVAVIGAGVYQFYKAYAAKFEEHLRKSQMSATARCWARRIGRAGLTARGVTFGVIGWFLVRAALDVDPGEARGLAGALRTLARQDYGRWLLGVVALGLAAYGLLSLVEARYRRIT